MNNNIIKTTYHFSICKSFYNALILKIVRACMVSDYSFQGKMLFAVFFVSLWNEICQSTTKVFDIEVSKPSYTNSCLSKSQCRPCRVRYAIIILLVQLKCGFDYLFSL